MMHPDECLTKTELLDRDIAEANELKSRIRNALHSLTGAKPVYHDTELVFRNNAIKGMLEIALSDMVGLCNSWEADAAERAE